MKAYSMDLRERIVLAREQGESVVSVAQRFGVCTKTVRAYQRRASKGQLSPRRLPGKAPRLRAEQEAAFVAMVEEKIDWTIEQLSLEWEGRSGCCCRVPRCTTTSNVWERATKKESSCQRTLRGEAGGFCGWDQGHRAREAGVSG